MPNKSKITEKVTVLTYSTRLALHSRGTTSCPVTRSSPASQPSRAGLCHLVMIYLPRVLSCPGISTRTCNGYVAGRGHVYTAQHRALSEIPIWLGGSQHTYVEQQSSLQKYKPEIPSHIQTQKRISSALHMHSFYLPNRQDQGQQRDLCVDLCCARLAFPTEVAVLPSPPGGKTSSSLSLFSTVNAEIPSALSSPSSY